MSLMDMLQHYTNPSAANNDPLAASGHFDEVARNAPSETVGSGLAEAFRSDQTPPFGQMVGHMFGRSDPQQRAGVLNHLLSSAGPGILGGLGGGVLGNLLGGGNRATRQITPEEAAQVSPEEVDQLATKAQQSDPGVMDKIGGFYSAHPDLVKTLGAGALTVALASIAGRMRSR